MRRLAPPLATAAAVVAAAAYIWAVDPNEGGHYPGCPTQVFLGIDCPACGGLRGSHALLRGDLAGAADNNILLFLLIPALALVWLRWVVVSWRGAPVSAVPDDSSNRLLMIVLIIVMLFGIVRNFVPYLGSGLG